jgi:amidohydrolase
MLAAGMSLFLISSLRAEDIAPQVDQLVRQLTPQVIQWRRDIHAHPELGNRETRTSQLVADHLRKIGADDIRTGVAHHGVVALVRGRLPGPVVALRADIDALPIQEQTGLPYASETPGVMHACGHDAHTAMLLGAATVLVHLRDRLPGTVKLLFQPAEEGMPAGEDGGAGMMVKEGVLDQPKVDAIFALHIRPDLPCGQIGVRPGVIMAGVERFHITVRGKQSHGAMPWQGVDPIVAAAHVITAIQTISSRHIDARQPVVVSVGIVKAGTAWNIIPAEVTLEGTIRTHDAEVHRKVLDEFHRIVTLTAQAHGTDANIHFEEHMPRVTSNDPALTARMRPSLVRAAGETNTTEVQPMMAGEDFSHYLQKVPGMFFFLGVGNPAIDAVHALHTPQMRIDEAALPVGVRALVFLAADYLDSKAK